MPIPAYTAPTPNGLTQYSGRIVISIGAPAQVQVAAVGSVASPSASDPIDPSTGTFCDFLEFTVQSNSDGSNNIDFDTSEVDSFGLPVQLQFFQKVSNQQVSFDCTFTGSTTDQSATLTFSGTLPASVGQGVILTGPGIVPPTFVDSVNISGSTLKLTQRANSTNASVLYTAQPAGPVGPLLTRDVIFGTGTLSFQSFINAQTGSTAELFMACIPSASSGIPPLRLISPKDLAEMYTGPAYTDVFNNYFNTMLDTFFTQYFTGTLNGKKYTGSTFSITSQASGSQQTYSGGVVKLASGNYVLQLTNTTNAQEIYNIYYPFFTGVTVNTVTSGQATVYTPFFPTADCPGWLTKPNESASQMTFACDGVFADSTEQTSTSSGFNAKVLGDIEDSISAAFNRGIALNDPSTWGDISTWFDGSLTANVGVYDYWVQYWHQNGVMQNQLAYAFAYDDKHGASTNMQQSNVSAVAVTLGSWGTKVLPSIALTLPSTPVTQGGPVTLSAAVSGSGAAPAGTVTFFIDGYAVNSAGYPAGIPALQPVTLSAGIASQSANCPPMPNGSFTHTFTVTAVYSGDSNYLPAVTTAPLTLNGFAIFMGIPSNSITLGQNLPATAQVQMPFNSFSGTLFLMTYANGDPNVLLQNQAINMQVSSNPISISSYQVPVLTITGQLTNGSTSISNVSSFTGIANGQGITGTGIPANTTISSFNESSNTLTMSAAANAQAVAGAVTITSDGTNADFQLAATFQYAGGGPVPTVVVSPYNFVPVV